jgi:protein involved in polysaccharide export with SLBB domain
MSSLKGVLIILLGFSIGWKSLAQDNYKEFYERANKLGLSESEIMSLALSQGYSFTELDGFSQTIEQQELVNARLRQFSSTDQDTTAEEYTKELYFGSSFFERGFGLTFEPDENMPTPSDYILGPGDQVYVDIYGLSEQYYNTTVTPDGYITLVNLGSVNVQGRTINELNSLLKAKFGRIYTDLLAPNPKTFLQVGLINVRSIQVHIAGEVKVAGSYTMNGFSTVLNALYAAGGPTPTGSLRSIKVLRNSKVIQEVDVYKFLLDGNTRQNIRLESNDVILIPPYLNRVNIKGEVKRPTRYEIKPGESISDLIRYAGGFTPNAYINRISLSRPSQEERLVADVFQEQFDLFQVSGGDEYMVHSIKERYKNRVLLEGAVMRPGNYALTDSLTLLSLLDKAGGLAADAYVGYALLTRQSVDLELNTEKINLRDILMEKGDDILLQREDKITIQSRLDLQEKLFVKVSGEVMEENTYPYMNGMKLSDILFMAKGFKHSAKGSVIEISRRIQQQKPTLQREILSISLDAEDSINMEKFEVPLEPYDHIMVRRNPDFIGEEIVTVSGEVNYPGEYTLISRNERISDLVERSGGINEWAFLAGATLIRKTEYYKTENEIQDRIDYLNQIRAQYDSTDLEAETLFVEKLDEEIQLYQSQLDRSIDNLASAAKRDRLEEIQKQNPLLSNLDIKKSEVIPIKLDKILANNSAKENLILKSGDILIVPDRGQTIRLRGKVLYPATVSFVPKRSAKYYVNQAGGFDQRAMKRKTYVLYPNGEVARTRQLLVFNKYPKVLPGSEVIVPQKPVKVPLRPGEIVNITTGLSAILVIILNQLP